MTDARLPGHFLMLPAFDELSDSAVRIFVGSLMWSAEHGTDGVLPSRYLRLLHPDGLRPDVYPEIVASGFWVETRQGFEMPEWSGRLGQSTAEQVERYREGNRLRQQKFRERKYRASARSAERPRHVTRDVGDDVGEGESKSKSKSKSKSESAEQGESASSWNVASIPTEWIPDGASGHPHSERSTFTDHTYMH